MSTWLEREARRINKARLLLQPALTGASGVWADLGCGDGVFTYLLTRLLPSDSLIYAVDRKPQALSALTHHLAESNSTASVQPIRADFTQPLSLPPLDGLLLANALHFVRAPGATLGQLTALLKPGGRLVVVEYNTRRGNEAVPYPLDEHDFLALAAAAGLQEVQIVTRTPSTFLGEIYTGLGWAVSGHKPAGID
jgi:ubiquinone/menaquinone biosynthesis C-methylase UbiE